MSEEIKRIDRVLPNTDAGRFSVWFDDGENGPGEKAREIYVDYISSSQNRKL